MFSARLNGRNTSLAQGAEKNDLVTDSGTFSHCTWTVAPPYSSVMSVNIPGEGEIALSLNTVLVTKIWPVNLKFKKDKSHQNTLRTSSKVLGSYNLQQLINVTQNSVHCQLWHTSCQHTNCSILSAYQLWHPSAYQQRHTNCRHTRSGILTTSKQTVAYCQHTKCGILTVIIQTAAYVSIPTAAYCQHTKCGILTVSIQTAAYVSIPTAAYCRHTNSGKLTLSQFVLINLLNCEYNPQVVHSPKLQGPVLNKCNQQN